MNSMSNPALHTSKNQQNLEMPNRSLILHYNYAVNFQNRIIWSGGTPTPHLIQLTISTY